MWLLIVQAEYGEYSFVVQAKTRPKFEDFWESEEPVHSHRWVELVARTTSTPAKREGYREAAKATPEYTAWLL